MQYRTVPPRSDRGSIKDIQKPNNSTVGLDKDLPPTPAELRIKALYEEAVVLRDDALIASLGLIVMGGPPTDPVAIMRHRMYVQELKEKLAPAISDAEKDIELLVQDNQEKTLEMRVASYKQENALNTILSDDGALVKKAGDGSFKEGGYVKRSFWRSKE